MRKVFLAMASVLCCYSVDAAPYMKGYFEGHYMSGLPVFLYVHLTIGSLIFGLVKWLTIKKLFKKPLSLVAVIPCNYLSFTVSYIVATFIALKLDINMYGERLFFADDFNLYLLAYFSVIFITSLVIEFPLFYLLMTKGERNYKLALKYSITANFVAYSLSYFLYLVLK